MSHQEVVPPQPSGLLGWTLIGTKVSVPPPHECSTLNNLFCLNNLLILLNCPPNCLINLLPSLCPIWPRAPYANTTTSLTYQTCLE